MNISVVNTKIVPSLPYKTTARNTKWIKNILNGLVTSVAIGTTVASAKQVQSLLVSETGSGDIRYPEIQQSTPLEILRNSFGGFQTVRLLEFSKQYLRESPWGGPCDAMFEYLVNEEPTVFLNLIRSGSLEPGFLSTAAEFAGQIDDPEQVIPLLLKLTLHDYPMVREGAVYGLASFISVEEVRQYLQKMSKADPSPGVRSAAQEMLED